MTKTKKWIILGMVMLILATLLYRENHRLTVTAVLVEDEKIPEGFGGYRILQLSDLHGQTFGKNQSQLLAKIQKLDPHLIVITGDFLDQKTTDLRALEDLTGDLLEGAPVYVVSGNHEGGPLGEKLLQRMEKLGARVLRNEAVTLTHAGDELLLAGLSDPALQIGDFQEALKTLSQETAEAPYRILLAHRPEYLPDYAEASWNLVFSGHAHGGQFRLPGIGGLVAPGQGFFPPWDAGLQEAGDTLMMVSRGLGNSIIPQRLGNPPELVLVTLRHLSAP